MWRAAHALTLELHTVTDAFPREERFRLVSQLRRSAASIGANLVEGSGRSSQAAYTNFVEHAAGSAAEVEYHLLLARDVGYLAYDEYGTLAVRIDEIRRMLAALRRTLREHGEPARRR